MRHLASIQNWVDPIEVLSLVSQDSDSYVLLHSSLTVENIHKRSILAAHQRDIIVGNDVTDINYMMSPDLCERYQHAWFGYFGYGLKNSIESLSADTASFIDTEDMTFIRFGLVMEFDHEKKVIEIWADDETLVPNLQTLGSLQDSSFDVASLASNMTKHDYLDAVAQIKQSIERGDLYQANLTRKFYGRFSQQPDTIALFKKLCSVSPSPYGAYMKLGDIEVVSSSPECFLRLEVDGRIVTKPIKGSIAASKNADKNEAAIKTLKQSVKDRAENLMIVDLCRNDLSRVCVPGSVQVDSLFNIESYETIHHKVSTVTGMKRHNVGLQEIIAGTFPPGSMTGAPKIAAMERCSMLEQQRRGVYSGALGMIGGDGYADLSVVIRTLIIQHDKFEFQVGGAIVYDSDPHKEWEETLVKSRGVGSALGISEEQLASL